MAKTVWHSGPPPEIGWWPASLFKDTDSIRWWDGEDWSQAVTPCRPSWVAGKIAKLKLPISNQVKWTDRWWLNPAGGHP